VPSAAEYVLKTTGRARRAVEAMMRPLEHLGKKLPAVPDARPIFSDSPVNWNDYKGKVTLVVIWSTQYEDAKAAMREANVLAAKVSGDVPFQIVGIVLSENEGDQEIDQWLGQNELSEWPQVVQSGEYWQSPVLQAWGLADQKDKTSFWRPYTTFLLDKTARVKYANVPVGDHMEKLIRAMR